MLLRRIISESYVRNASKLVVTIPIISPPESDRPADDYPDAERDRRVASKRLLKRCLDLGATDVMSNPMNAKCVTNLEVHAYRAHRDAALDQQALVALRRGRTRSWVGIADQKPYSYLREAMVSKLLDRICRIESEIEDVPASIGLSVSSKRQADISSAVGLWEFSAHDFNDDELVEAAMVMFKHALSMPELAPWRISTGMCWLTCLSPLLAFAARLTNTPPRPTTPLSSRLPAGLHRVCSISQLSPRGRRPAGNVPLPCLYWLTALLSAFVSRDRYQDAIREASGTV